LLAANRLPVLVKPRTRDWQVLGPPRGFFQTLPAHTGLHHGLETREYLTLTSAGRWLIVFRTGLFGTVRRRASGRQRSATARRDVYAANNPLRDRIQKWGAQRISAANILAYALCLRSVLRGPACRLRTGFPKKQHLKAFLSWERAARRSQGTAPGEPPI